MVLATAVSVALAEATLRALVPQALYGFSSGLFVADARLGYRLQPRIEGRHVQPDYAYVVRANSLGFRGPEPRLDATRRVLVLGDSFAFGQGVADGDGFTDLLRRRFASAGVDVDLLNTGMPGYSLVNERGVLEELLPTYRPTAVIQLLYWNDVGDRGSLHIQDGDLVLYEGQRLSALRRYLNGHSHLFAVVKAAVYRWKQPLASGHEDSAFSDDDLRWTAAELAAMRRRCDAVGAHFLVVIVPVRGAGDPQGALRTAAERLLELLRADETAYVDLHHALDALTAAERRRLVFRHDHHWSPEGHRFFARPIGDAVAPLLAAPTRNVTEAPAPGRMME